MTDRRFEIRYSVGQVFQLIYIRLIWSCTSIMIGLS